jgi:isopenicillin N synthase-like dioxygenase
MFTGEEVTNNQVDHREQLQFAPEQMPLESFRPTISPDYEGLQGPNQWPASTLTLLPHFKPCILEFMDQLEILSHQLMEAVALSLGLPGSYFRHLFGESPYYRLKSAKYPSVNKPSTIGCGAHKDTGFLTVLLQDMVGGLQGQDPVTGQWLDTKPIPGTFIVTMGEAIEELTGGLYHATVHRVMNNTSGKDRYSIPFFFDPSLNARIPSKIENLATSARLDFESVVAESSSNSYINNSSSSTKPDGKMEQLVQSLSLANIGPSRSSSQEGWCSGAHVFDTVHRCHPEVYSRWYCREY